MAHELYRGSSYPHASFPELTEQNFDNARLFANRTALIQAQTDVRGGVVAEVGIALGDFTQVLLELLEPKTFYAIDVFRMHEWPEHWGRSSDELFGSKTHRQQYEGRFASLGSRMVIEEGFSPVCLARLADASCDLIYVDAGHDYDTVARDAQISVTKLKRWGVLVFNYYIMYDHMLGQPYGVVQAVNELVASSEWRVTGFALQQHMFCDISLRRR